MLSSARAAEDPLAEAAALQQQATVLFQQGRYGEIEPLLQRAIAMLEQQFGPDDPQLADSVGYLADLYEIEGRYDAAEPVYRRVLTMREKAPGPDRLDLGAALNGLAGLYKLQGRYGEAEKLYRRALDIVEKAANPPAAIVATILSNLALVYQNEGRYDDGLGPVIRNNLGGLYKEERRWAEAEPLYKDVLQLREAAITTRYVLCELDWIKVKGKEEAIAVYELVGEKADASPAELAYVGQYQAALERYRMGDFAAAEECWRRRVEHPALDCRGPSPPRIMAERCAALRAAPPPSWDGVFVKTTK